jgi:anaerobic magnesium-protoporphyrin IX monomethyl ester cyclase
MRILMIQPNYHAGGAEIAGTGHPAGSVCRRGAQARGLDRHQIRRCDDEHHPDDKLREIIRRERPDVVLATPITPMIYQAQTTLRIAKEVAPGAVTVLGGIHPTFMYAQV